MRIPSRPGCFTGLALSSLSACAEPQAIQLRAWGAFQALPECVHGPEHSLRLLCGQCNKPSKLFKYRNIELFKALFGQNLLKIFIFILFGQLLVWHNCNFCLQNCDVKQPLLIVFDKWLQGRLYLNRTGSDLCQMKTILACLYFPWNFQIDQTMPIIWTWGFGRYPIIFCSS